MKISASIYSDKKRSLKEVITDLQEHQVDMLHIDCNDDISVFDDIAAIREISDLPLDLHIITKNPSKYYDGLRANPVDFLTFQYEDLEEELVIPNDIKGKKGIGVITPTSIDVFEKYTSFDFILIMATIPGQSGGKFAIENFAKIREFKSRFPSKEVYVDGGVNAEVSFILRNMGVESSVSGSYLFNAMSVGDALMNLTKRDIESHYLIKDFMTPIAQSPSVFEEELSIGNILNSIEEGKVGFTMVTTKDNKFVGIVSNADIRKGLLRHLDDLNQIDAMNCVNNNPVSINENQSVDDMLQLIKSKKFPILYLPVINDQGFAVGIVTFVNLIKGEL